MLAQRPVRPGDAPVSRRESTKVRVEGLALAYTITYRVKDALVWPLRTIVPCENSSLGLLGSQLTVSSIIRVK